MFCNDHFLNNLYDVSIFLQIISNLSLSTFIHTYTYIITSCQRFALINICMYADIFTYTLVQSVSTLLFHASIKPVVNLNETHNNVVDAYICI